MRIKKLWVVCDPSADSVIEDICFEATPDFLADYMTGAGAAWAAESHALYTEESEAERDAEVRLAGRAGVSLTDARVCADFFMQMAPEDVDRMGLPETVLSAIGLFDGAPEGSATQTEALQDLTIAIGKWLVMDREACIATLEGGLRITA